MLSSEGEDLKDKYTNCLTQQLDELEILKSIYPNPNEIILTENSIVNKIKEFLDNKSEYIPNHLDYIINISTNDLKIKIYVNLPTTYPNEEPDLYIRCSQLNHQQEMELNKQLSEFIHSNYSGEVCLYSVILWLQETAETFTSIINEVELPSGKGKSKKSFENKFVRMWIYSHHIYNKKKREEIVKKAKDFQLTGFCLPGKPGIICIEGSETDCKEWWKEIKSLSWKKIEVRETEIYEVEEHTFSDFKEIILNMSDFQKYLSKNGLSKAFNEVFRLHPEIE